MRHIYCSTSSYYNIYSYSLVKFLIEKIPTHYRQESHHPIDRFLLVDQFLVVPTIWRQKSI